MTRLVVGIAAAMLIGTSAGAQSSPRGEIFIQRGCNACHSIWALGVKAKSDVAPDLTFAYVEVGNRYGMSLEAFLHDPSGVMRLMLASHLHLSLADRDSIAHVLEAIYKQHRAQLNQEVPPIAPDTASSN